MKEIYIVTGGSYSDYRIESVFDSYDKASEYARLLNNADYEVFKVETHPLNNKDLDVIKIVRVDATKKLYDDDYDFKIEVIDIIDEDWYSHNTDVYVNDIDKYSNIKITRKLNEKDVDLELLYRKIIQDYFFMVESNWDFYKEWSNRDELSEFVDDSIDKGFE